MAAHLRHDLSVKAPAERRGIASAEAMRTAFPPRPGVSPEDFRERLRSTSAGRGGH